MSTRSGEPTAWRGVREREGVRVVASITPPEDTAPRAIRVKVETTPMIVRVPTDATVTTRPLVTPFPAPAEVQTRAFTYPATAAKVDTMELHEEEAPVRLDTDDARTVREAGARFASDLAGAAWVAFMVAPAEQGERLRRAVLEAGHGPEQARLAAAHFETAARDEWVWLEAAGGAERQ